MSNQIKYLHLRRFKGENSPTPGLQAKGGLTIAYTERIVSDQKVITWSTAQCSRNDVYNRRVGRDVAGGRLIAAGRRSGTEMATYRISVEDDTGDFLHEMFSKPNLHEA